MTLDFPGGKVNGARPSPAGPRLTWCLAETEDVFAALGDTTRLGILEALWRDDASISDLAARFGMTLTGIAKHVRVLEDALLVATEKVGRVRTCRLGPRRLDEEAAWLARYRQTVEDRYDSLAGFLDRMKETTHDHAANRRCSRRRSRAPGHHAERPRGPCRTGRTRIVSTSMFHTAAERDGMLGSGMAVGLAQRYAALDALLTTAP